MTRDPKTEPQSSIPARVRSPTETAENQTLLFGRQPDPMIANADGRRCTVAVQGDFDRSPGTKLERVTEHVDERLFQTVAIPSSRQTRHRTQRQMAPGRLRDRREVAQKVLQQFAQVDSFRSELPGAGTKAGRIEQTLYQPAQSPNLDGDRSDATLEALGTGVPLHGSHQLFHLELQRRQRGSELV